jgi:hypothetical protein
MNPKPWSSPQFTLATFAAAQAPTINAQPNTVFVGADGKFETAPDTALIQFNITAQADTARPPTTRLQVRRNRARFCAPTASIPKPPRSILLQTRCTTGKPKAQHYYQVITSVSLKLKISKIGAITQQLADADVARVNR